MDGRSFANLVERYHKVWLGVALSMLPIGAIFPLDYNHKKRVFDITPHIPDYEQIDLQSDEIGIEMKCRCTIFEPRFDVYAHQIPDYEAVHPDKTLYWAFLFYDLLRLRKNLTKANLKRSIGRREVWFLEWDFVKQFPEHIGTTGNHVYVRKRDFPLLRISMLIGWLAEHYMCLKILRLRRG